MLTDNYDIWEQYDKMCARWERMRPICAKCHEHITGEIRDIFGVEYCEDCYADIIREEGEENDDI